MSWSFSSARSSVGMTRLLRASLSNTALLPADHARHVSSSAEQGLKAMMDSNRASGGSRTQKDPTEQMPHGFDCRRIRKELATLWHFENKGKTLAPKSGTTSLRSDGRPRVESMELGEDDLKDYLTSNRWNWMCREMSSNMAGETGAVWIYHGALAACRLRSMEPSVADFASRHIAAETAHLEVLQGTFGADGPSAYVHRRTEGDGLLSYKYTRLLPMWRAAGWSLGFVPTLLGKGPWLYHTVEAVETFVEKHYEEQIEYVQRNSRTEDEGMEPLEQGSELLRFLTWACADEVHHAEDARRCLLAQATDSSSADKEMKRGPVVRLWSCIVDIGSRVAADLARKV